MDHVRLPAGAVLTEPPVPLWALVLAGGLTLEAAFGVQSLAEGDAVLIDARTAHRLTASGRHEESALVVADLRVAVPVRRLPSPLVVRGFGARHGGVMALVSQCPLERACRPTLFAASYGNLIGAAMTTSWQEDEGGDAGPPDGAVTAVVAAVAARPAEPWTVEGMARLVHLSRSALGERFRRALGRGPAEVLREIRMREARRLLADPSVIATWNAVTCNDSADSARSGSTRVTQSWVATGTMLKARPHTTTPAASTGRDGAVAVTSRPPASSSGAAAATARSRPANRPAARLPAIPPTPQASSSHTVAPASMSSIATRM
ncbi:hypothetical protein ABZ806_24250 [Spirillospora sp. NPDC047418]